MNLSKPDFPVAERRLSVTSKGGLRDKTHHELHSAIAAVEATRSEMKVGA